MIVALQRYTIAVKDSSSSKSLENIECGIIFYGLILLQS